MTMHSEMGRMRNQLAMLGFWALYQSLLGKSLEICQYCQYSGQDSNQIPSKYKSDALLLSQLTMQWMKNNKIM
jgi:hypothetical protein